MLGFEARAGNFSEKLDHLIQGHPAADPDVENLAGNIGRFAGEQIGLHGVFDVCEIAGYPAVAKNHRLRFVEKSAAEFGEHTGIRRAGILARTEHVEVAQANVLQAVAAAEGLEVELADEFRDAVGRDGHRPHRLDLGQSRRLAIGGRRSGENDALHLGIACGN